MITVIGLGSAGCNIAEMFENNPLFQVKLIDKDIEGENCFSMVEYSSPEEYENNTPDLTSFFKDCNKEVFFIIGGGGNISGASLKILSYIKNLNISLLYIRPDTQLLSNSSFLQEKVTFNVFQQYARSGLFKKMFIISNEKIESLLGDIPVYSYYSKINEIIFNIFSSLFYLQEAKALIDNYSAPKTVSRIATVGIFDLENNIENMFYEFNLSDDKCYNFVINENVLKTDGKLFKNIKDRMKEKFNNTKISYKIFNTQYENNYCYVVEHTKIIQP